MSAEVPQEAASGPQAGEQPQAGTSGGSRPRRAQNGAQGHWVTYPRSADSALDTWENEGGALGDRSAADVRLAYLPCITVVASDLSRYEVLACPLSRPGAELATPRGTAARIKFWLRRIPDLAAALDDCAEPGGTGATTGGPRPSRSRPPVVLDVVDLTDGRLKAQADDEWGVRDAELDRLAGYRRLGVLPTLGLWVSMVTVELADLGTVVDDCCPVGRHTIPGECAWLLLHADQILALHSDFVGDIGWIHRDLEDALGIRPEFEPKCTRCGERVEGQYLPDEQVVCGRGPAWWRCPGCGQTWTHAAEVTRLFALQGMTLAECARHLGKPISTLRSLKAEGRFMPVGRRGSVALYDVEIIARALARVRPVGRPKKASKKASERAAG